MSPFWSCIYMNYKTIIQGEVNWLDSRNRESEILSLSISDLEGLLCWWIPSASFLSLFWMHSAAISTGLPAVFDSSPTNTSLGMPTALDLVFWYLVTMILISFLWQLPFLMSSHPMLSLDCPNQCTWNLGHDLHHQGIPGLPPLALSSVSPRLPVGQS